MVGKPYTIAGRMFVPSEKQRTTIGLASWYGEAFHGRRTANGEVYDCDAVSAAHPTMPLPSYARVTNLENRHSLVVRVNDRGPFHENRILDVSRKTAEILNFHGSGTTRVKVEYIGPAGLAGSDDSKLLATLRTNGPANLERNDRNSDIEIASSAPSAAPAGAAVALLPDRAVAPGPPLREPAVAENPLAPTRSKGVAMAFAAPLPPQRPYAIGTHASAHGANATRIARAGSDKPVAGH
jgi:rare lipoprotein A